MSTRLLWATIATGFFGCKTVDALFAGDVRGMVVGTTLMVIAIAYGIHREEMEFPDAE